MEPRTIPTATELAAMEMTLRPPVVAGQTVRVQIKHKVLQREYSFAIDLASQEVSGDGHKEFNWVYTGPVICVT
jgi:hypothetical protein